jgi:hypothetical protein
MNTKQSYMAPEVEILYLQFEGAVLSGSGTGTGTGADVKFENDSDFDSFFN